jgi:DNA polymerase I-like protein with 3'-5' exonuclease and polymerase domains
MLFYIGKDFAMPFERSTVSEAAAYLREKEWFVLDTETTKVKRMDTHGKEVTSTVYEGGLDPYLSRVIMLQIGDLEKQFVIDTRTEDITELLPLFTDPKILKILHNSKFDAKHIFHCYGVWLVNTYDTMLAQNVRQNGARTSYAMDACAERVLGYKPKQAKVRTLFDEDTEEDEDYFDPAFPVDINLIERAESKVIDKSIRMGFVTKSDKPFTVKEVEYGADDVIIPAKLYLNQKEWLETSDYNPIKGVRLQNKFALVLAQIEYWGAGFDPVMWKSLYEKNLVKYEERRQAVIKYVESNPKLKKFVLQLDLFNDKPGCSVQWTSPVQVISVFRALGICPKEKSKQTKKEEWTVSAKALYKDMDQGFRDAFDKGIDREIVDDATFRLGYLLFKKSQLAVTTFGTDFFKYVHPVTKKLHSSYKQMMHTGRMSSTAPNLQNIPSGKEWRACFTAPKGRVWICVDYSSQESRLLAEISGVENLISFFRDGHEIFLDDFHAYAATAMQRVIQKDDTLIITKETDPELRQKAKSLNFSLSYGATKHSLRHTLNCDEMMAELFIEAYFDGFPGLREDFENTKQKAVELGYIVLDGFTEQRYWFPDFKEMNLAKEKALALYPPEWKRWSKERRDAEKPKLYEEHPEIPELWKTYMSMKGDLERKGLNYRIQGTASAMTKAAACYIYDHCIYNQNRRIVNIIHDEIICETTEDDSEQFAKIIVDSMVKAGTLFCSKVPMGATPEIANYWKH